MLKLVDVGADLSQAEMAASCHAPHSRPANESLIDRLDLQLHTVRELRLVESHLALTLRQSHAASEHSSKQNLSTNTQAVFVKGCRVHDSLKTR